MGLNILGKRRHKGVAVEIYGTTTMDPLRISIALANYFYGISSFQRYPNIFLKRRPSPETAIQQF